MPVNRGVFTFIQHLPVPMGPVNGQSTAHACPRNSEDEEAQGGLRSFHGAQDGKEGSELGAWHGLQGKRRAWILEVRLGTKHLITVIKTPHMSLRHRRDANPLSRLHLRDKEHLLCGRLGGPRSAPSPAARRSPGVAFWPRPSPGVSCRSASAHHVQFGKLHRKALGAQPRETRPRLGAEWKLQGSHRGRTSLWAS